MRSTPGQKLLNGPRLVGKAGSHCGRGLKRRMDGRKIVNDPPPEHLSFESLERTWEIACASDQRRHALSKRGIEPFNGSGIDGPWVDLRECNQIVNWLPSALD